MYCFSLSLPVPSQPPQNVRAITVTSDEAVITWSEPPRMTLNGVLKGYRVVFWSLFPDGGECYSCQILGLNQCNYTVQYNYCYNYCCLIPQTVTCFFFFFYSIQCSFFHVFLWLGLCILELLICPRWLCFNVLYKSISHLPPLSEWGEMQNITTVREQVELKGLEKFTNYSVQVLAYTQAGDGVRSNVLYIQTREDCE